MYSTQAFFGKKLVYIYLVNQLGLNLSLDLIIKQAKHKNNDVFSNKYIRLDFKMFIMIYLYIYAYIKICSQKLEIELCIFVNIHIHKISN